MKTIYKKSISQQIEKIIYNAKLNNLCIEKIILSREEWDCLVSEFDCSFRELFHLVRNEKGKGFAGKFMGVSLETECPAE